MAKKKKKAKKKAKIAAPKSKVGSVISKIADVGSKLLPGPMGLLAKGIGSLFNDPEWWMRYGATGLTTNAPLRLLPRGPINGVDTVVDDRPFLLEHVSSAALRYADGYDVNNPGEPLDVISVVNVPEEYVTSFIIPQVRHVLNAVPLQPNGHYGIAYQAACTLVAMKYNLRKLIRAIQNQSPVLPPYLTVAPITAPENYATLQALILRIDTTLKTRVRLPDITHEVLQWRFGRVYKSRDTEKASWVMYNVLPLGASIDCYTELVKHLENLLARTAQANADLFNAYASHKQDHELSEGTDIAYDLEEFILRTNVDVGSDSEHFGVSTSGILNLFYMDSALDNKNVFQATVTSAEFPNSLVSNRIAQLIIDPVTPRLIDQSAIFPISDVLTHTFVTGDLASFHGGGLSGIMFHVFSNNVQDVASWDGILTGTADMAYIDSAIAAQACIANSAPHTVGTTSNPTYDIQLMSVSANTLICNLQRIAGSTTNTIGFSGVIFGNGNKAPGAGPMGWYDPNGVNSLGMTQIMALYQTGFYAAVSMSVATEIISQFSLTALNSNDRGSAFNPALTFRLPVQSNDSHDIYNPAVIWMVALRHAKALDLYGIDLICQLTTYVNGETSSNVQAAYDLTALSIDAGVVTPQVLYTTQRAVSANMVNPDYKTPAVIANARQDELAGLIEDSQDLIEVKTVTGR